MNQQTLILDLDDTLIHCNKYFDHAKNRFASQMKKWFQKVTKKEIIQKQLEFDLLSVEKYGLHSSRYPESLVTTYLYFSKSLKREVIEGEIHQVRRIGESVFEQKVQPYPFMYKVLNELKDDGHELFLFTGGDVDNQTRKINQLCLREFFEDRVFIAEHKDTRALQKVLTHIKSFDKDSTWMIGNSLKTDILPAIELGINAIHIPSENEWTYNIIEIDVEASAAFTELSSLIELPGYLRDQDSYDEAI